MEIRYFRVAVTFDNGSSQGWLVRAKDALEAAGRVLRLIAEGDTQWPAASLQVCPSDLEVL